MNTAEGERAQISGRALPEDAGVEERLRPRTLDEMIGQDRLRENLKVFVRAARERSETLDHMLFHGPPGLGKTSLAHVVAHEMAAPLRVTSGPAIDWFEPTARNSNLLPVKANGLVRFRSPLSFGSGGSVSTPTVKKPPLRLLSSLPFSICSKMSVSMSPRKIEMIAGGASFAPRR